MIEQSTFTECAVAGLLGLVAGYIAHRITTWLKPGDWR